MEPRSGIIIAKNHPPIQPPIQPSSHHPPILHFFVHMICAVSSPLLLKHLRILCGVPILVCTSDQIPSIGMCGDPPASKYPNISNTMILDFCPLWEYVLFLTVRHRTLYQHTKSSSLIIVKETFRNMTTTRVLMGCGFWVPYLVILGSLFAVRMVFNVGLWGGILSWHF